MTEAARRMPPMRDVGELEDVVESDMARTSDGTGRLVGGSPQGSVNGHEMLPSSDRVEGFVEDGFEQAAAFGPGGGELPFQPVAQGHQLVHLGDDAALLGQGRDGDDNAANLVL